MNLILLGSIFRLAAENACISILSKVLVEIFAAADVLS